MRNKSVILILMLIIVSGPILSAQQGPGGRSGGGGGRPGAQPGLPGGDSTVAAVEVTEQFHTISLGGRLEPKSRIVHQTTSSGYVQSVLVTEGQSVEIGQELLTIKRKDDVMDLYKPAVVTARIPGRISEILVQTEDEVNSGQPAMVIISTAEFLLKAKVSDKDAFRINIGQRVSGSTANGRTISGVLKSRSQEPDYQTGLFELNFVITNTGQVNIGEFVLLQLPIDRTRGIFVPRDAVSRRYGSFFVWVVNEADVLNTREVVLGEEFEDLVQIVEGLEPGERYLVRLTGREKEGDSIGPAGE